MNCKPGQMAEIIYSRSGNVGGTVEILQAGWHPEVNPAWLCKPIYPMRSRIDGGDHITPNSSLDRHIPGAWLRPIRPPEQPETTDTPEELTA